MGIDAVFDWLQRLFGIGTQLTTQPISPVGTPSYPWYGIVEDDELQQGDIFENCPIFRPPEQIDKSKAQVIRWEERDLIVISQSCDLVKERKDIEQASLCEVWRRSEYRSGFLSKPEDLEQVRKGRVPRFHLLAPSNYSGFERELRIVDLQQVHSLPIEFLRSRAQIGKRLRLLPPYREHLSQSFARLFMRVGLPIDIPPIRK